MALSHSSFGKEVASSIGDRKIKAVLFAVDHAHFVHTNGLRNHFTQDCDLDEYSGWLVWRTNFS